MRVMVLENREESSCGIQVQAEKRKDRADSLDAGAIRKSRLQFYKITVSFKVD